jgi:hypothetical protein
MYPDLIRSVVWKFIQDIELQYFNNVHNYFIITNGKTKNLYKS